MKESSISWEWEISSKSSYWSESFKSLWSYRHFIANLVRREFLLNYQQTILGPLWILFQPLLTLITYVLVFTKMVKLSTGSLPPVLFYFSGIILWNLFSEVFGGTSGTFKDYSHIFSKVYFPRIIIPFAIFTTHFLRFLIQFSLFLLLISYYVITGRLSFPVSYLLFTFPVAVIGISVIAFAIGLIISVLNAKYRDIGNLMGVAIRLLMFITPVIYSLSSIDYSVQWIVKLNPLTPFFELFRLSLLGEGAFDLHQLIYSIIFMLVVTFIAVIVFNKQGDKLIDVV